MLSAEQISAVLGIHSHYLNGAHALPALPVWATAAIVAIIVIAVTGAAVWLTVGPGRQPGPRRDNGEEEGFWPPGGGPGPRPTPPADLPESPLWWPDFERDFEAYVNRPLVKS